MDPEFDAESDDPRAAKGAFTAHVIDFVLDLAWSDVPAEIRSRITSLLRDFIAVSLAGRVTPTAQIAADYAVAQHAGEAATVLFDGRRASAPGAAFANGVLANALDFDDGHRLVKGHPGSNVVPAAVAIAEQVDATEEDVLAAIAVGYEIAIRAGSICMTAIANTTPPAHGARWAPRLPRRACLVSTTGRFATRSAWPSTTHRWRRSCAR